MIKPISITVDGKELAKKGKKVDISDELKKEIEKNTLCKNHKG